MDWIIFGLVVAWLGMISWFDIRKKEIPHSLWVIISFVGACAYRIWQGDWSLTLLAVIITTISERVRISECIGWKKMLHLKMWFPLLFLGIFFSVQVSYATTLAIIGFWAAWELKLWGGADAITAIVLNLFYPGFQFILVFLIVHVIATIGLTIRSLIKEKKIGLHKIPGLPLLLITVISTQIIY